MNEKTYVFSPANIDRRRFLQLSSLIGLGAATGLLNGCAAPVGDSTGGEAAVTVDEMAAPDGPVGELVIVQGVDAESLDPHVTTSGASKGMMWAMYDLSLIHI